MRCITPVNQKRDEYRRLATGYRGQPPRQEHAVRSPARHGPGRTWIIPSIPRLIYRFVDVVNSNRPPDQPRLRQMIDPVGARPGKVRLFRVGTDQFKVGTVLQGQEEVPGTQSNMRTARRQVEAQPRAKSLSRLLQVGRGINQMIDYRVVHTSSRRRMLASLRHRTDE